MLMRDIRLGDDIDDFCVRCKRVMNHAVVSVIAGAAAKVRCRTCHSDHDFRHEQPPPPKVDARKAALFQEVLKKVNPDAAAAEDAVDLPDVELEGEGESFHEVEGESEETVAVEAVEEVEAPPPVVEEEPKPKAKATKAKGKAKK
jgi:hypothetical protein